MPDILGPGAAQALRHPPFRRYFAATALSSPGSWMQVTAQAWLVLSLDPSPMALALMTALQSLPIMLLTLFGGALTDSLPRKRLLIGMQIAGAAQATALAALVLLGEPQIWQIYLLALVLGCVNALDGPLRQAVVADLSPRAVLADAVALMALTQNLGRVVGPALAGLVIVTMGTGAAFMFNMATFVLGAMIVATLPLGHLPPAHRMSVLSATRQGLAFALGDRPIRLVLIATAFIGLFGQNFGTMVPLVAHGLLQVDADAFGLINAALGAGSLAGIALLVRRGTLTMGRVLLAGCAFGALLLAISQAGTLWASCLLFACVGAAAVSFSTAVQTALQMMAPPGMRGRLASMATFLIVGTSPIGALLTGAVAQAVSVSAAVALNGALCVLGVGLAVALGARRGDRFEPSEADMRV